ncbi:UNVERIFIED_ORG: C40 family peptidase [Shinella sp. XGS7]|nr:C40 family peptidase [Shinella sp. XGS7]
MSPTAPLLNLLDLPPSLVAAIRQAAEGAYPRECCGLVVALPDGELRYWPCRNLVAGEAAQDRFSLAPEDWAAAEDAGTVVAVVHSHPNACANPSVADRVSCERSGLPWLIMGWPSGALVTLEPRGRPVELVGREFAFGVQDCYTLIQDYYRQELGVELPHFDREDGFWQRGQELYRDNLAKAGFVEVQGPPQLHDMIVMQVASDVGNHGAVYVGDGQILHHIYDRLSCRDPYGGYWQRHTRFIARHVSQMGAQA